ncbi:AI-2E family transporter [Corallococcus macrosporus DSM 14697]|uniref:AI-2E family transporter n=1 Tax=Corallococcus macrosporus DSM 14697 TaxID=1189310 RepID=A0A250JW60_9BACT|nr:AI-2E family transporter [Corallococcus macrosporus]ATB47908.1 AI-2E family transporter [Corallococcus macrosporus DSM 14697]
MKPAAAPPAPVRPVPVLHEVAPPQPHAKAVSPAQPAPVAEPVAVDERALSESDARRIDLWWSAVMLGSLGLVFALLSVFGGVAVPVLLALAGAYVFNPIVTELEKRRLNRTWGTTLVFVAGTLMLVGGVLYLIPVFREEASKLPDFFNRASTQVVPKVEGLVGHSLPDLVRQRTTELGQQASELVQSAGPAAARILASFAGNTARLVVTLLGLSVVPVLAFFFLQDYPRLMGMVKDLLPRRAVGLVSRRFAEVDEVLSAFVRGQLIVGGVLSVIYAVGLSAARIDMAIVIGVIAGFGNMVPYLGTGVGIVLSLVGLMLSWQGPWQLAAVAATFVIGQMLEGFVITPRIVGEKVGLAPVAVILAILAFGELFGFVGILLAVPVAAILKVVLSVVVQRYQRTRLYTGEPRSP